MLLYSVRHWTTRLLRMKGYFLDLCLHPEVLPRALHRFNFKLLYQLDLTPVSGVCTTWFAVIRKVKVA